ncbi:MAG: hypothetical protein ABI995_14245, partial [Acidobacteriota bacterium]
EYLTPDGEHVEAMTPDDVIRFEAIRKRPGTPPRLPLPLPSGNKKGPLNTPEIEGRAFSVKLVPAGEAASGFVYFQADSIRGAKLYLSGISDAASGKAYFYFEIPLDSK